MSKTGMKTKEEIQNKLNEEKKLWDKLTDEFNEICNESPGLKYTESYLHIEKHKCADKRCWCRERIKTLEWVLGD